MAHKVTNTVCLTAVLILLANTVMDICRIESTVIVLVINSLLPIIGIVCIGSSLNRLFEQPKAGNPFGWMCGVINGVLIMGAEFLLWTNPGIGLKVFAVVLIIADVAAVLWLLSDDDDFGYAYIASIIAGIVVYIITRINGDIIFNLIGNALADVGGMDSLILRGGEMPINAQMNYKCIPISLCICAYIILVIQILMISVSPQKRIKHKKHKNHIKRINIVINDAIDDFTEQGAKGDAPMSVFTQLLPQIFSVIIFTCFVLLDLYAFYIWKIFG